MKNSVLFQSTLSRRERQYLIKQYDAAGSISIHALPKRATKKKPMQKYLMIYFNPRSPEESDHTFYSDALTHVNFNPRSPEESDFSTFKYRSSVMLISIHALPKRATSIGIRTLAL